VLTATVAPARTEEDDHPAPEGIAAARIALIDRLMDGLLHDARNPLNAMAINLEVMAERIKREQGGALPPHHEKCVKSMRDQIGRVDSILKAFAQFIAPPPHLAGVSPTRVDFSAMVQQAVSVCGHEARRKRVEVKVQVQEGLEIEAGDPVAITFLAMQPLARAIGRLPAGGEVKLQLGAHDGHAVLRVTDGAGNAPEASPESWRALEALSQGRRGQVRVLPDAPDTVELRLPLGGN
jgi:signal transduction histidine kinase